MKSKIVAFRLDNKVVKLIVSQAKKRKITKTQLVKQSLAVFLNLKVCPTCHRRFENE